MERKSIANWQCHREGFSGHCRRPAWPLPGWRRSRSQRGIAVWVLILAFCAGFSAAAAAVEADPVVIRIGTGEGGGAYFAIGARLAETISGTPSGAPERPLLGVAQHANGSVENVRDIADGLLDVGFAQADIVHNAYHGAADAGENTALSKIRVLAYLYAESLFIVARANSEVQNIQDLRGKRVALGAPGSGTLPLTESVLQAIELPPALMHPVYVGIEHSVDLLTKSQLDAFFLVGGRLPPLVGELLSDRRGRLVPIDAATEDKITAAYPYIKHQSVSIESLKPLETVGVGALLIASTELDEQLAHSICKALWSRDLSVMLTDYGANMTSTQSPRALADLEIPLHDGARRYYEESGQEVVAK